MSWKLPPGWERKGATAIATIDDRITICKIWLRSPEHQFGCWTYEVWRKGGGGWKQERVHLPSLDAALEIAEGRKVAYEALG